MFPVTTGVAPFVGAGVRTKGILRRIVRHLSPMVHTQRRITVAKTSQAQKLAERRPPGANYAARARNDATGNVCGRVRTAKDHRGPGNGGYMRDLRDPRYLRTVAKSVGVPEFWLEDAAQDIALATWRDERPPDVLMIRREAIDAARRYGTYGRSKRLRPVFVPLNAAETRGYRFDDTVTTVQSVRVAFANLTTRERLALRRRLASLPMSNSDSARAASARKKLRVQLAG